MNTRLRPTGGAWGNAAALAAILAALLSQLPPMRTLALEGYDNLFQLALGLNVAHCAWPGVDFFTNYGPGVAVTSALSWLWPTPFLPEVLLGMVLCAAGVFALWKHAATPGRWGQNTLLLALLALAAPIWPKYYYVFFPGCFLLWLGDPCGGRSGGPEAGKWFWLGALAGLASWFRIELGLGLGAALLAALALKLRTEARGRRDWTRLAGLAAGGGAVPWIVYFGALSLLRGAVVSPWRMLDFFVVSTFAKAVDFATPTPWHMLRAVGVMEALMALGAVAIVIGFRNWRRADGVEPDQAARRKAWCAAAVCLCLLPQSLHRVDWIHLSQVVLPGISALFLAFGYLRGRASSRAGNTAWGAAGVGFFSALFLLTLSARGGWTGNPLKIGVRMASLAKGVAGLNPDLPDVALAARLRRAVEERGGGTMLIPSIDTRYYALAGVPFGGLVPHWAFHLPERWQRRAVAALEKADVVVVLYADYYRSEFVRPSRLRQLDFEGRNPPLDRFVSERFTEVIHQDARFRVLVRPE